ncbi:MAG: hypothetical protein LBP22_04500 [Deltaproteobacteria bacterium]|nr:hypothetical protein [Deltaproteobacteria bacterium]
MTEVIINEGHRVGFTAAAVKGPEPTGTREAGLNQMSTAAGAVNLMTPHHLLTKLKER